MANTPRHGRRAQLLINERNFTTVTRSVTHNVTVDVADTTVLNSTDKTYVAGHRDNTLQYEGIWEGSTAATQEEVEQLLGSSTPLVVSYLVEGSTTGGRARLLEGHSVAHAVQSPFGDVVSIAGTIQGSSRAGFGDVLLPLAARTSTSAGTAIDSGVVAGTTRGGVGHWHVTAASTVTSITAKVQHSSNASAWSDLVTFTATTDVTAQRSTVAGSVKRYVRGTVTAYTGGAGKTATYAITFARHRQS